MTSAADPTWVVREDAAVPVLIALYVRQRLGIRSPDQLPPLRDAPVAQRAADDAAGDELERQWTALWEMTVEPQAHPSAVPLQLVDGYDLLVALPGEGFDALHRAMLPFGADAVAYARAAHARYRAAAGDAATVQRAYAGAVAQRERAVKRPAHGFGLTVQVLPLAQRGLWWIAPLTIAVTDRLRDDVVAFDRALQPVIADLA